MLFAGLRDIFELSDYMKKAESKLSSLPACSFI